MTARARLSAALLLATALVVTRAPAAEDRTVSLSASCGASCAPAPSAFAIPQGHRGRAFRLASLVRGELCAGKSPRALAGFRIRRGRETVLVYYEGPDGVVSDPLPLEDLVLGPGVYELLAVPARGASVALTFQLEAVR